MIVCDTHPLIFNALATNPLGPEVMSVIEEFFADVLACADISLWKIAMPMEKGRSEGDASKGDFITAMITARDIMVLPIASAIAAMAVSDRVPQGDPAHRLIVATAISPRAALIKKDKRLAGIPGLSTNCQGRCGRENPQVPICAAGDNFIQLVQ